VGKNYLPSKSDTCTGSRGLVHLTKDQGDLGLAIKLNDRGLLHFVVQIVALTGALADTSEDGVTTVGLGDVVDELLDEDSLANTSTTEETNLSTTSVGSEEIDDLDTSDQNLSGCRLLDELGRFGVNRESLVRLDGTTLIDRVTSDVHDTAKGGIADTVADCQLLSSRRLPEGFPEDKKTHGMVIGAPAVQRLLASLHRTEVTCCHLLSTALAPRTRPSVPIGLSGNQSDDSCKLKRPTIHGNASYDALTEMLLCRVSMLKHSCCQKSWHTETSSTSFWPLLTVSRAFRIGGSLSVSNLTVSIASDISVCTAGASHRPLVTDHRRRHLIFARLAGEPKHGIDRRAAHQ